MGKIIVAGIGPGEIPVIDPQVLREIENVSEIIFRTEVHPGASEARRRLLEANPSATVSSFDYLYEKATSFDDLYKEMVSCLLDLATRGSKSVLYLVPGSPLVAERSVEILRREAPETVVIIPGFSFLDLSWVALGIDPFAAGVTMIDATEFPSRAKVHNGPYLLTQVWSSAILSEVKLSLSEPLGAKAVVLQRLGCVDQSVIEVPWDDLDKVIEPDHLTSIYVPQIAAVPGPALIELFEIIARLRTDCPWDREQTHKSLVRHLLEESYEVIDVIENLEGSSETAEESLYEELKGELGDLLVQVYFHANLAQENGLFDLGDVAATVTKKLIRRHPHVFSDLEVDGAEQVISNWEVIKQTQEGRNSILDGIPTSLPALLLAPKLMRKGTAVGLAVPEKDACYEALGKAWTNLESGLESGSGQMEEAFGELLWWLVGLSKSVGIDLEAALRNRAKRFMEDMKVAETEQS